MSSCLTGKGGGTIIGSGEWTQTRGIKKFCPIPGTGSGSIGLGNAKQDIIIQTLASPCFTPNTCEIWKRNRKFQT